MPDPEGRFCVENLCPSRKVLWALIELLTKINKRSETSLFADILLKTAIIEI
ncbi:uncharacterized protein RAG0_02536 [Rhynchosporium agropyri]|uniref:Uncharacterized protein n=1 Tax=Rhynchosporium agropyri TaxID=914238 RepID=A0A1E1K277_9HELO|nr:uncharacterized protein RAG0_02536 [Rhynchosporium agropyri]